jgi:hypothetical protein
MQRLQVVQPSSAAQHWPEASGTHTRCGVVALALAFVVAAGCSGGGIKTYPVRGKVEVNDGDVELLTGSHVEFRHESQEMLRPTGKIAPGGNFVMQTMHEGKILPGAPAGKYKARIILGDESDEGVAKHKGNPVHKRFLNFETSGLAFTIPGDNVTVSVSKK